MFRLEIEGEQVPRRGYLNDIADRELVHEGRSAARILVEQNSDLIERTGLWFQTTLGEFVSGLPERGDISVPPIVVGAPRRGFFSVPHS